MKKSIVIIASVLITTGCSMLPKVPVEAHCRSTFSYENCMEHYKRLKERRQGYSSNSAHDRPLFDTNNERLEMNPEARMLMDINPSVDGYQNAAHQSRDESSIVIRDAYYQGGDHDHKNHQHMQNIDMHENELSVLKSQIAKMQKKLDASKKHQVEHSQLEASFTQHRETW